MPNKKKENKRKKSSKRPKESKKPKNKKNSQKTDKKINNTRGDKKKKSNDKSLFFDKTEIFFLVALFLIVSAFIIFETQEAFTPSSKPPPKKEPASKEQEQEQEEVKGVEKFSSVEDFKNYIQEGVIGSYSGYGMAVNQMMGTDAIRKETTPSGIGGGGDVPERVSGTNVQVLGIDEPDIVKTDGEKIYFSPEQNYYLRRVDLRASSYEKEGAIKVINAFPPEEISTEAKINKGGDLLLVDDVLVLFTRDKIYGYDISDPKNPQKKWKFNFNDKTWLKEARLYKDKVYLVTRTGISSYAPCPIKPLTSDDFSLTVKCSDIYHPVSNVPVETTYTVVVLNPANGEIEKDVSFVGNSGNSVVYMSENGLYITYSYIKDQIKFFYNFFKEEAADLIPSNLIERIRKLIQYDISNQSKAMELQVIISGYMNSLDNDERLRIRNELQNRLPDYYNAHKRELERTGVIKINRENLKISSVGEVAGMPLNQFSLDEYRGNLRIATTTGRGGAIPGVYWYWNTMAESTSDVYVLNDNLQLTGSVKDLGVGERIYSVRFLEDKGYVVTFKEVDPFFVLDLSDPRTPKLKGELKIPGYSSYLHPITKDKILGIGKEQSKVKISIFDVSDPNNPKEESKYTLDEYWSDVLNTHHAFLLDKKHQVFFLPGGKGGYVFSYQNDKLSLAKALSIQRVRRALYMNDYLYIIADEEITVLDENDWEKVSQQEI